MYNRNKIKQEILCFSDTFSELLMPIISWIGNFQMKMLCIKIYLKSLLLIVII